MAIVTIGIDLTPVSEVSASMGRFGSLYSERLFTARELAACAPDRPDRLAVRFAAKEATVKALAPGPGQFPGWHCIEVLEATTGAPSLTLSGPAADLARAAGIDDWMVSTGCDGSMASAMVFGIRKSR